MTASGKISWLYLYSSRPLQNWLIFYETGCLLLRSNGKIRTTVNGSIMLLMGDARYPPDFRDGEGDGARRSDLPQLRSKPVALASRVGTGPLVTHVFFPPLVPKGGSCSPSQDCGSWLYGHHRQEPAGAVNVHTKVLHPVTVFHWYLEECRSWCAQPTDGVSLRLNLGCRACSL